MSFVIPKNTATAVERRIPFVLVDATDLITPEDITVTGVKVDLSFGGGTDAPSTNDIVKVDGAKGMYYLELTQTEANNAAGAVHGYLKPTGCAATYLEAQIGPSTALTAGATSTAIADAVVAKELEVLGTLVRSAVGTSGTITLGGTTFNFTASADGVLLTLVEA